jgi:hypothetical protein
MEEDDMVIRVGNSLEGRDEPIRRVRRAANLRSL